MGETNQWLHVCCINWSIGWFLNSFNCWCSNLPAFHIAHVLWSETNRKTLKHEGTWLLIHVLNVMSFVLCSFILNVLRCQMTYQGQDVMSQSVMIYPLIYVVWIVTLSVSVFCLMSFHLFLIFRRHAFSYTSLNYVNFECHFTCSWYLEDMHLVTPAWIMWTLNVISLVLDI